MTNSILNEQPSITDELFEVLMTAARADCWRHRQHVRVPQLYLEIAQGEQVRAERSVIYDKAASEHVATWRAQYAGGATEDVMQPDDIRSGAPEEGASNTGERNPAGAVARPTSDRRPREAWAPAASPDSGAS